MWVTSLGLAGEAGIFASLPFYPMFSGVPNGPLRLSPPQVHAAVHNSGPNFSGNRERRTLGYSGFLVGRCELGCRIPFPSPSYDSRSVLAVKGSLRRAKRAPLTAPGRSEAHNLYEGKGIRGTSHLSTISASAPQSAFHRSTVLKYGRLLARSWPVPPTRNPEEPQSLHLGCRITMGRPGLSGYGFQSYLGLLGRQTRTSQLHECSTTVEVDGKRRHRAEVAARLLSR